MCLRVLAYERANEMSSSIKLGVILDWNWSGFEFDVVGTVYHLAILHMQSNKIHNFCYG